ncbi:unnamed protein product [Prorocentrum cordatum]|uniref:Uncharacterized protein n=1 Tax=Prorocentrum cordatum TaxID=2364126 RepID=A0ABN9REY4_9DINO|nr:unnamed protein product [Polarella glacialis]
MRAPRPPRRLLLVGGQFGFGGAQEADGPLAPDVPEAAASDGLGDLDDSWADTRRGDGGLAAPVGVALLRVEAAPAFGAARCPSARQAQPPRARRVGPPAAAMDGAGRPADARWGPPVRREGPAEKPRRRAPRANGHARRRLRFRDGELRAAAAKRWTWSKGDLLLLRRGLVAQLQEDALRDLLRARWAAAPDGGPLEARARLLASACGEVSALDEDELLRQRGVERVDWARVAEKVSAMSLQGRANRLNLGAANCLIHFLHELSGPASGKAPFGHCQRDAAVLADAVANLGPFRTIPSHAAA